MPYLLLVLLCAAVFLLCFAVDMLLNKLRKKWKFTEGSVVRMPKRSACFGIVLVCFAVCTFLFWVPPEELWLKIGCGVVAAMGAVLIGQYFSFAVSYDETGFAVRQLGKAARRFSYAEIEGQRSLMTRSGVNVTLFAAGESIMLTSGMDGADAFLRYAFGQWCKNKERDPDSIQNNPQMMTYFPDKD